MNLTKDQVATAIHAGLEILSPESEHKVPMRLLDATVLLRSLLRGIAEGRIALVGVEKPTPPAGPPNPKPTPKPRRKAKNKVAKRRSKTRKKR